MLAPCRCWQRACVHFTGVVAEDESDEVNTCTAFPEGIPDSIAYGEELHLDNVPGDNGVTFERDFSVNIVDRLS